MKIIFFAAATPSTATPFDAMDRACPWALFDLKKPMWA